MPKTVGPAPECPNLHPKTVHGALIFERLSLTFWLWRLDKPSAAGYLSN